MPPAGTALAATAAGPRGAEGANRVMPNTSPPTAPKTRPTAMPPDAMTDALAIGTPRTSRVPQRGQRLAPMASGRAHLGQSKTVWLISPMASDSTGAGTDGGGAAARRRVRRTVLTVIEIEPPEALDAEGFGGVPS